MSEVNNQMQKVQFTRTTASTIFNSIVDPFIKSLKVCRDGILLDEATGDKFHVVGGQLVPLEGE